VAYVAEDIAQPYSDDGRLVQVLQDWCPTFPGFQIYYSSRRPSSRVLALLVEALRGRA
jgi:DNA-binding transcriptional LysR family regulator